MTAKPQPADLDLTDATWQGKSDVQIAFVGEHIAMRNAADPDGEPLIFNQAEWKAFVLGARDGEFDLAPETDVVALGHRINEIEREQGPEAVEAYLREHASEYPFYQDLRAALVADGKLPPEETS